MEFKKVLHNNEWITIKSIQETLTDHLPRPALLINETIKSNHGWYKENLASGKIDAKNDTAQEYALSIGKEFKFLLDFNDFGDLYEV